MVVAKQARFPRFPLRSETSNVAEGFLVSLSSRTEPVISSCLYLAGQNEQRFRSFLSFKKKMLFVSSLQFSHEIKGCQQIRYCPIFLYKMNTKKHAPSISIK